MFNSDDAGFPTEGGVGGFSRSRVRRFWRKVKKREPDQCWLWTGATDRHGYGVVSVRVDEGVYRNRMARRIAYELVYGLLPEGVILLSTCHMHWCVNPEHHYLGNDVDRQRGGAEVEWERAVDVLDRLYIIELRHGRRATLQQIAEEVGLTIGQVRYVLDG